MYENSRIILDFMAWISCVFSAFIVLMLTTFLDNLADDKLIFFLLIFLPENKLWNFIQIKKKKKKSWNVKTYFLDKKKKKFKMSSAEIATQHIKDQRVKVNRIFKVLLHRYRDCLLKQAAY